MKKNNTQIFELNILMGLPGSGKTYFAKNNYEEPKFSHNGKCIINVEAYKELPLAQAVNKACDNSDMKAYCGELFGCAPYNTVYACIDGLFTTKDVIKELIKEIVGYININCAKISYVDSNDYLIRVVIHRWDRDIETCIHNDKMRIKNNERIQSSETTIKNIPYDNINKRDFESILNIDNISIVKHQVKYITNYNLIFEPLIGKDRNRCYGGHTHNYDVPGKTKYMYSEEWSGGGDYSSCWGSGTISPEKPNNFDEFDNLIIQLCPTLSFINYKKLWNECVDVEETQEYDYYGGCEIKNRWRCDMEKLYGMLKSLNIITDYD